MAKTDFIHVRIEPNFKNSVENTLNQLGLTTTEAINVFLKQVVLTGGIPFNVKLPTPNAETVAAINEARKLSSSDKKFKNTNDLFKELNK